MTLKQKKNAQLFRTLVMVVQLFPAKIGLFNVINYYVGKKTYCFSKVYLEEKKQTIVVLYGNGEIKYQIRKREKKSRKFNGRKNIYK